MQIINTILLSIKELKFIKLDGTTDPCLHVCIFLDEVYLFTLDEDLHTWLFPLYLKGKGSEWFNKIATC